MQGANWHKYILTAFLLLAGYFGQAQVTANLTSQTTMVRLGMPFEVELTVRHPEKTVVIFPDSAKDFIPYEIESSLPRPTNTDAGFSEDVKIYQLYNWIIDSAQTFQLPVKFIDSKGDTQTVVSNQIELLYQPEIAAYADSLQFKMIDEIAEVREPVNWIAWGILITVALIILLVIFVVGYKPVRNWLRRGKIEREYKRYLGHLMRVQEKGGNQEEFLPELNKVWRGYFDRDKRHALSALTTTELKAALPLLPSLDEMDKEQLAKLSEASDLVTFAGRPQPDQLMTQYFEGVKIAMEKEYKRRKEAIEL